MDIEWRKSLFLVNILNEDHFQVAYKKQCYKK
jgi:hypothetical protein